MNQFDDLVQRVNLLNAQIRLVEHQIGSEVRRLLDEKLWRIVEELNQRLGLGLENTALDLYDEMGRLVIHYYNAAAGTAGHEIHVFVDRSFRVENHTTDRATGEVKITDH
jgi:hypothetical protein